MGAHAILPEGLLERRPRRPLAQIANEDVATRLQLFKIFSFYQVQARAGLYLPFALRASSQDHHLTLAMIEERDGSLLVRNQVFYMFERDFGGRRRGARAKYRLFDLMEDDQPLAALIEGGLGAATLGDVARIDDKAADSRLMQQILDGDPTYVKGVVLLEPA